MDEPRKRKPRWLLGVLMVAIAAGTIWVATALAGGGASAPPAGKPSGKGTPAAKVPAKAKTDAGRDCPYRDLAPSSLDV